jgi:hypothetical protein
VIWATAVHGEVDILSACFVLLFLVALGKRWYFLAGIWLALGIVSKAYPLALLPVALTAVCVVELTPGFRSHLPRIVAFLIGVGAGLAPFVSYAGTFITTYGSSYPADQYGGFNVGLVFNRTNFLPNVAVLNPWLSASNGSLFAEVLRALFYLSIPGSIVAALLLRRAALRDHDGTGGVPVRSLLYALEWPLAGVLLFQPAPQSENLITLLAILLLIGATGIAEGRRTLRILYWALSGAGWMLYLTLASPLAYFYPLAAYLGPGAISGVNHVVVAFSYNTLIPRVLLWSIAGLVGGSAILGLWAIALAESVRTYRDYPCVLSERTEVH